MNLLQNLIYLHVANQAIGINALEIITLAILLLVLGMFSYLTNPFVRFSLVAKTFLVLRQDDGTLDLKSERDVIVRDNRLVHNLAGLKSGWHILTSRFAGGTKSSSKVVDDVIAGIHELRFRPEDPFLISGDHFSVLYLRSLGIFYHSLMDSRTALSEEDWANRQAIYLKTTGYALQVFANSDRLSTTIVPIGRASVALVNIYAYPSDTLYSLLYALRVMQDDSLLQKLYPFETTAPALPLNTKFAAEAMTAQYQDNLQYHLRVYHSTVFDPATGLVKKNLLLSGAKDITVRSSAFYDNVILWATHRLAQELHLEKRDQAFLDDLKARILATFWLPTEGYFLEDLSPAALKQKYYSSDWLIVLMTGFLDPAIEAERVYYEQVVEYIQRNAIDQPFGLQYHPDLRRRRQYLIPQLVAPSYGSTAIWSNWGMEYVKILAILSLHTHRSDYLHRAKDQIGSYSFNIKRYRGYPEVYDAQGDFYRQIFYKSVRQTGWVVSFEEARDLVEWAAKTHATMKS